MQPIRGEEEVTPASMTASNSAMHVRQPASRPPRVMTDVMESEADLMFSLGRAFKKRGCYLQHTEQDNRGNL